MDVILPNRSLLIVDKGWLKGKPSGEGTSVGSQQGQHTHGQTSKVDDIAITVLENPNDTGSKRPLKAPEADRQRDEIPRPVQCLRFVNATTPAHNKDPDVRRLVRSHVRKASKRVGRTRSRPVMEPESAAVVSSDAKDREYLDEKTVVASPNFSATLSGSTTSLYGGPEFPIKPRFHELINCCTVFIMRRR